MGQQVTDVNAWLSQAQLARCVLHVVPAAGAGAPARATALADDVVDEVLSASRVAGRGPLQHEGGLIDTGNHSLGRRGDGWGGGEVLVSGGLRGYYPPRDHSVPTALAPAQASERTSLNYFSCLPTREVFLEYNLACRTPAQSFPSRFQPAQCLLLRIVFSHLELYLPSIYFRLLP